MKSSHVTKSAPDTIVNPPMANPLTANPLWVIAVALMIFLAGAAILVASV